MITITSQDGRAPIRSASLPGATQLTLRTATMAMAALPLDGLGRDAIPTLPRKMVLAVSDCRLEIWDTKEQRETGKFAADMRHPASHPVSGFPLTWTSVSHARRSTCQPASWCSPPA